MGLIRIFVRHPVAPNLAMAVMVLAGIWALMENTRQLLPSFQLNVIQVNVEWTGASAEDVEEALTRPLEDELVGIGDLRNITSVSRDGRAEVSLEFPDSIDMGGVLDEVKEVVSQVRNLPLSAEEPQVSLLSRTDPVTRVIVSGPDLAQLRPIVRAFERQLRSLGIAKVETVGLPKEEIAIQIPSSRLSELNLSLADIAARVRAASQDVPAGTVGREDVARQLRTLSKQRSVAGFAEVPLLADESGRLVALGDIAQIQRRPLPNQATLHVAGQPAVEMRIRRAEQEDALDVADTIKSWMADVESTMPDNVSIQLYDRTYSLVEQRINLLLENALTGLALVVLALYVFLNGRVALWVAVGIPVSIMAALTALYVLGGTLNMISMFAMVMALGIIVDDAIVVGEEAVTRYQAGAGPMAAAEQAAYRMLAPVTAASLTTIAAFVPLLTISGPAGSILFAIPLIIICVVVASLLECFLVLPGHLRHSLQATAKRKPGKLRRRFDVAFRRFRDRQVRSAVAWAVTNRSTTIAIGFAGLIVTLGLILGGRLGFTFFPQPDGPTLFASARFVAGSPPSRVDDFLDRAIAGLEQAEKQSGEQLVNLVVKKTGQDNRGANGDQLGVISVELVPVDERSWTNAELISAWRRQVPYEPGLESFVIGAAATGPPGYDIEVQLSGADVETLKRAALELSRELETFPGVSGIRDDTPYGKEQLIFELTAAGQAIGLTEQSLSDQLRAGFDGELVQIFQDLGDEVEVRLLLSDQERQSLRGLETLPIVLQDGETATLANVARLKYRRGFDSLRHSDGLLTVKIVADVDAAVNNANAIRAELRSATLPELTDRFGISYEFKGDAENQAESVGDVIVAVPLALIMIYIILAWVFASYSWPFAVLSVIPFGIVGALFGHFLIGLDVTLFSVFGMFGLSGIVINDSIILVTVFKEFREKGMGIVEAAIEAGVRRFRAVMLTSVTTVLGVGPLLFERAQQAQFLKPMVASVTFGLIFGTFMVIFLLPSLLVALDRLGAKLVAVKSRLPRWLIPVVQSDVLRAGEQQEGFTSDPSIFGRRPVAGKTE